MNKITPLVPTLITLFFLTVCGAIPCFSELISSNKKVATEYRDKGLAAQKSGDLDTALICYQKSMEVYILYPALNVNYDLLQESTCF